MAASSSEPGKYAALSRYYIRKADAYLRAGDRGQASEKGWGAVAVAVALKSIAEEWGRPDGRILFIVAKDLHANFYEDNMELDDIAASVGDAKTLLGELEVLRQRAARGPVIRTREQRNRWRRLTGELRPPEV